MSAPNNVLPFFPRNYAEHEKHVIATATEFTACDFRGNATYATTRHKTLAAARRGARKLIAQRAASKFSKGRPVLVYAIAGPHQVLAETVRA